MHVAMKFRVELIPEKEGGFSAVCPELPGCQSQGETREEALANIKEAIELYLEPTPGVKTPGADQILIEV
jgi:predicted RNase H-like HicB family nuclease